MSSRWKVEQAPEKIKYLVMQEEKKKIKFQRKNDLEDNFFDDEKIIFWKK